MNEFTEHSIKRWLINAFSVIFIICFIWGFAAAFGQKTTTSDQSNDKLPPQVTPTISLQYDDVMLMFAIMKQESSLNKDKRRGDYGQSWGPFQIKLGAVMDVNSYYDTNFAHSDVLEIKTGWWIATLYMDMWANSERLGRPATIEDRCRIFKGGPRGYKDERTIGWWLDVRQTYISLLSRPRGT